MTSLWTEIFIRDQYTTVQTIPGPVAIEKKQFNIIRQFNGKVTPGILEMKI